MNTHSPLDSAATIHPAHQADDAQVSPPVPPNPADAPLKSNPAVPGGPLPTPDEQIKRNAHRRRRNVPTDEEIKARAATLDIPGLEIFAETAAKGKSSGQGRYLVKTKCCDCGHEMPQVLTALKQGKRKKCRCQGGVRGHADPIRYSLRIRYRAMHQRCNTDTHVSSHHYKGRGIKLLFTSTDEFVEWALSEFPEQAGKGFKGWDFDRIDNDGHYEKSNLRLACRSLNHVNRGESKTSNRARVDAFRNDHQEVTYSHVTLRNLFQQGFCEEEILQRHAKVSNQNRRSRSENPAHRSTASILAAPGGAMIYPLSHPEYGNNKL